MSKQIPELITTIYYFCFTLALSLLSLYRLIVRLLYAKVSKEEKLTATILFGAGANGLKAKRALDDSNSVNVLAFVSMMTKLPR